MAGNSNSGPRRPTPRPTKISALGYLKGVVQNEAATARERGASARALVAHEARLKRDRQRSSSDEAWQNLCEAGWFTHWHVGFLPGDDTPPTDWLYGRNLLRIDDPPRDPKGKPFRLQHPPEAEYRQQMIRDFEQRTGQRLLDADRDWRTGLALAPDDE